MWVLTTRGFYSAVEKPQDRGRGTVTVRTRNRKDIDALVALISDARPYRVAHSDYAWRVRVTREQWQAALAVMVDELDYSNFKDEVKRKQGRQRADLYARVWSVLWGLRDPQREARRRRREVRSPLFDDDEFDAWRGAL